MRPKENVGLGGPRGPRSVFSYGSKTSRREKKTLGGPVRFFPVALRGLTAKGKSWAPWSRPGPAESWGTADGPPRALAAAAPAAKVETLSPAAAAAPGSAAAAATPTTDHGDDRRRPPELAGGPPEVSLWPGVRRRRRASWHDLFFSKALRSLTAREKTWGGSVRFFPPVALGRFTAEGKR